MSTVKELQIAWAAGIIEGEGCFSLNKNGYGSEYGRISVKMTDEDIINRLQQVFNAGHVHEVTAPSHVDRGFKRAWTWEVGKSCDVERIVEDIFPYLGERRQIAAHHAHRARELRH